MRIQHIHKTKCVFGCLLMALGVAMPYFVTIDAWGIPQGAYAALGGKNELSLWIAAMRLIGMNSLRAFPHYLGAFTLAESVELAGGGQAAAWLKAAAVCILIPAVYALIGAVHHIRYDFGLPAMAVIILLVLLGKSAYGYVSLWKKAMMILVLLTALQVLDLMPCLKGFPTGRGEMSRNIKQIAEFLEMDPEMNGVFGVFFLVLLFMGFLLFLLIRDENRLRAMNELKAQNERMLMETRLGVLENRTYLEMRHLVHDLKSPLTSAQALVGVVRMACEDGAWKKEAEYLNRAEHSIEKMSSMISEILYENHRTRISVDAILAYLMSQISVSDYASLVHVENRAGSAVICVNRIRFVRALINLLENAYYALPDGAGRIHFAADEKESRGEPFILFTIEDNGAGIDEASMELIWERDFSARGSHGLGLSFVKKAVDDSDGTIEIDSRAGLGTRVRLMVPAEEGEEEELEDTGD